MPGCSEDAISRNAQGIVLINEGLCIGCKECIQAYPVWGLNPHRDKHRKGISRRTGNCTSR
jgi:Fe-S-cluster-containing dehydrogenase component